MNRRPQPTAWITLPAEPTEAMMDAGNIPRRLGFSIEWNTAATYRAMVAARPALTDTQVAAMARAYHEATAERQMVRWDAIPSRVRRDRIAAMRAALKTLETL